MRLEGDTLCELWLRLLQRLHDGGQPVSPRAQPCRELIGVTLHLRDAHNNFFDVQSRKLSYRFMVAEWLWIWFGHTDVKTIARYNPNIAAFSDDGVSFNGAYGVPIVKQWPYVVDLLQKDPDSRQAVIQIYRQPERLTKDVPCTLSWQALVRDEKLHVIVTMRSSDVWLGLPYDSFNFTMLGNILAAQLNVELGSFTIHLGSSHLYERNVEKAREVLMDEAAVSYRSPQFTTTPAGWLDGVLTDHSAIFDERPWVAYARALLASTNQNALLELRSLCG